MSDSKTFQRLDAAGNDTESLKRHQSTAIGPQSDHTPACLLQLVERRLFRAELCCSLDNLGDFSGRGPFYCTTCNGLIARPGSPKPSWCCSSRSLRSSP